MKLENVIDLILPKSLVRRIRSFLMNKFANLDIRDKKRQDFESRRQARVEPHKVLFFFQSNDPYSALAAQFLHRIKTAYNIQLEICLVGEEGYDALPEPEMYRKYVFNDVQKIDGAKFRDKVDLLVGGAPCQSFSMVGKRKGLKDDRGNLTLHFIRKINEIKPKVFIFENVKALLNVENGMAWKTVYSRFKKTGYDIHYELLNAKNYGIPQNRERLFVVGFKKDQSFFFPKPIELQSIMQDYLEGKFDKKFYLPPKGIAFVTKQKNLKKRYTQVNGKIALCQKRNQQFNWHGDFVQVKKSDLKKYVLSNKVKKYVLSSGTKTFYSKPEIDLKIARPLISTMHKMHRSGVDNYISLKKGKIRKLTPRECLRLMGFPDTFKQIVSDTQLYRQTGNSIVVNIIIKTAIAWETQLNEKNL